MEIFIEAVKLGDLQARAAYLDQACQGNSALRQKVERLLAADVKAGSPPSAAPSSPSITSDPALGSRISHYKLLQPIGEGGCGMVYMAEQEKPVRRKVALKIIKLGMDTKQVVARFEAERQALALMDHPNIAKIFDAGVVSADDSAIRTPHSAFGMGRPYFVMELVRGTKITDYCDEHQLSTRQRLDLFMQVCHAVQHAHQKGIIHRDLKPSNVLVTEVDGKPVPKVIDFGIAKAIEGRLTDNTLFTAFEQLVGTPSYMSPEQASLSTADIDTRTDIYSLGVMLYQLLTGETPFDTKALLAAGLDEMRRTISERVPARPSTRLTTMAPDRIEAVARARGIDSSRFAHSLADDLDWIVMKCLEKERGRRYETANGLAMDVQRYLHNEPILARPPSRLYEFQKTVRRHWVGFAATAGVILVLTAGVIATSWQANRASKAEHAALEERDRAIAAEEKAGQERNHAEHLAAQAALDQGQAKLESGDSWGLLDLVRSFELAAHDPQFQNAVGRRWSTWHEVWRRRIIAAIPATGAMSPGFERSGGVVRHRLVLHDVVTRARKPGPWEHGLNVTAFVFSSDGAFVVTAEEEGTIRFWDVSSAEQIRTPLESGITAPGQLHFSSCGRYLFVVGGWTVGQEKGTSVGALVELKTTPPDVHLLHHRFPINGALFSADGERLAVLSQPDLQIWRTSDCRPVGPPVPVTFNGLLAFTPDGQYLACTPRYSGGVALLGVDSGEILRTYPSHVESWAATFSPDGQRLAWTSLGMLRVEDMSPGAEPGLSLDLGDILRGPVFNENGSLLAVGDRNGELYVINTAVGNEAFRFRLLPSGITTPTFLANGVLAARAPSCAYFWDLEAQALASTTLPDDALAHSLAFEASGTYLAVGGEGSLRIWKMDPTPRLHKTIPLPGPARALVFSAREKQFVVFCANGSMITVQPETGTALETAHSTRAYQLSPTLSPDGRRLALFNLHELMVFNQDTERHQKLNLDVISCAFAWDATRLFAGRTSGRMAIYDTSAEVVPLVTEIRPFDSSVSRIAVHPNETLIAGYVGSTGPQLYDLKAERRIGGLEKSLIREAELLSFSPDGSLLAVAGSDAKDGFGVELWHVDLERGLFATGLMLDQGRPVLSLAFNPDGRTLVVGTEGSTRLWHLPATPDTLDALRDATETALGFRFDKNGQPVFFTPDRVDEIRTRITQKPVSRDTPLDAALRLPPDKALPELEALAARHPEETSYSEQKMTLHERLIHIRAQQGAWLEAESHCEQAIHLGSSEPKTYLLNALTSLAVGDRDRYQRACRTMFDRFQSTDDAEVIALLAWTASLAPGALTDYAELIDRVQERVTDLRGEYGPVHYSLHMGALLARDKRYEEAVAQLEELDRKFEAVGAYLGFSPTYHRFLLAICHAHLGNEDDAHQWLNPGLIDARNASSQSPEANYLPWVRRLTLRLLQQEAESAMKNLPAQESPRR